MLVVVLLLLWCSLFRVAFLPPVNNNGALNNNNGALRLVLVHERERERDKRIAVLLE